MAVNVFLEMRCDKKRRIGLALVVTLIVVVVDGLSLVEVLVVYSIVLMICSLLILNWRYNACFKLVFTWIWGNEDLVDGQPIRPT
jgi:hypothetical protein